MHAQLSQPCHNPDIGQVLAEGGQRFGAQEVSDADWIELVEVKDRLAVEVFADDLGKGESETIVLAREMGADWVLVDERLARRKLNAFGIRTIGTLGILLKVPFNQSVMLAEEMERRGMPHEFYSYEGLKHYFSTSADAPQADNAADVSRFAGLPAQITAKQLTALLRILSA